MVPGVNGAVSPGDRNSWETGATTTSTSHSPEIQEKKSPELKTVYRDPELAVHERRIGVRARERAGPPEARCPAASAGAGETVRPGFPARYARRATSQKASLQHAPSSMSVRMSASRSALTVCPVGLAESQVPFGV